MPATVWGLPHPGNLHDPVYVVLVNWRCGHTTNLWMTFKHDIVTATDQICADCVLKKETK